MGGGRGEQGNGGEECRKTLHLYQIPGSKTCPGPGCSTPCPRPRRRGAPLGSEGAGRRGGERERRKEASEARAAAHGARAGPGAPQPPRGPPSRSGADVTARRGGCPSRGDWSTRCSGLAGAGAPSPPGRRRRRRPDSARVS